MLVVLIVGTMAQYGGGHAQQHGQQRQPLHVKVDKGQGKVLDQGHGQRQGHGQGHGHGHRKY